jgi:ribosomal protein L40E
MYCTKCGAENDDNAFRCTTCHEVLQRVQHAGKIHEKSHCK